MPGDTYIDTLYNYTQHFLNLFVDANTACISLQSCLTIYYYLFIIRHAT